MVIFGFVPSAIYVDESAGQVEFNVELIDGIIHIREIAIEFFTEDGSAQGMYVVWTSACYASVEFIFVVFTNFSSTCRL